MQYETSQPMGLGCNDQLGRNATDFDKYAFLADFDITRSTCGARAGRYASEVTQRAYMVWADKEREVARLRGQRLVLLELLGDAGHAIHNLPDEAESQEEAEMLRTLKDRIADARGEDG